MDVATLGIRVDAEGAVTSLNRVSGAIDKAGQASQRLTGTTRAQDVELRKLAEISRSMGDVQGRQFQSLIRLNGGMERFLQIQKQIDQEMLVADRVAQQHAASISIVEKKTGEATIGANRFRSGLSTLASQIAGVNPVIGQLSGLLGTFAVGTALTVGILAGLAAIGFAYNKLTEDTREAKKATDELIGSLRKRREEELRASPAGAARTLEEAQANLKAKNAALEQARAAARIASTVPTGTFGSGRDLSGLTSGGDPKAAARAVEAAEQASRQAYLELSRLQVQLSAERRAADMAMYEFNKGATEQLAGIDKKRHDERKKQIEDETKSLKEQFALATRIAGLVDFGGLTSNIDKQLAPPPTPIASGAGVTNEELRQFIKDWDPGVHAPRNPPIETARTNKALEALGKAAQVAGQALEYALVQRLGGGTVGGNLGASVAKTGFGEAVSKGAFGTSFASTQLGSAIFGPLVAGAGAIIGSGFNAFISDVFGGAARKRAAEAFRRAVDDFTKSLQSEAARNSGNTLEASIIDAQIEFNQRREEAKKLTPIYAPEFADDRKKQEAARAAILEKLNQLEAERIRQLQAEYAERKRSAFEDLEVRRQRALGNDSEADRLALLNKQQQELFEAESQKMGESYIARLKEIQALERSKQALDEITKSAVNLVQGYKYQGTIFKNLTPKTGGITIPDHPTVDPNLPYPDQPSGWPRYDPNEPTWPRYDPGYPSTPTFDPSLPSPSFDLSGDLSVSVVLQDGSVLGNVVLKDFKKRAAKQYGDSTAWSQIQ